MTVFGAAWLQPDGAPQTGGGALAISVELAFESMTADPASVESLTAEPASVESLTAEPASVESLTADPASVDLDNRKMMTVDAAAVPPPEPPPVSPPVSPPKPVPAPEPKPTLQPAEPQPEPESQSTTEPEPEPAPALATTPTPNPAPLSEPRDSVNTTPDREPAAPPPKPAAPKITAPGSRQVARATPSINSGRPGADKLGAGVLNAYLVKYRRKLALLLEKYTRRHPDVVAVMRILDQLQARPVELSDRDLTRIYQQVASCWEPPDSQENSVNPVIELEMLLDPEGRIIEARALDVGRTRTDPGYREASAAAIRAVRKCSPLWLPLAAYQSWQSLILTLDPTERRAKRRGGP